MRRYGEHILPVFDDPDEVKHIVWLHEQLMGDPVPVYWAVKPSARAHRYSWQQLLLDDKFFINTTTGELAAPCRLLAPQLCCSRFLCVAGRSLLYMEADGTNSDNVLGVQSTDLSFDVRHVTC